MFSPDRRAAAKGSAKSSGGYWASSPKIDAQNAPIAAADHQVHDLQRPVEAVGA